MNTHRNTIIPLPEYFFTQVGSSISGKHVPGYLVFWVSNSHRMLRLLYEQLLNTLRNTIFLAWPCIFTHFGSFLNFTKVFLLVSSSVSQFPEDGLSFTNTSWTGAWDNWPQHNLPRETGRDLLATIRDSLLTKSMKLWKKK